MIKSCYVHIPFCNRICSYCDFPKIFYNENFVDKYLDILKSEIEANYKGEILNTLYIGGGTPSSLSYIELTKLFKILSIFKLSKDCEITIEGNFESTTKDKLKLYKEFGINRLSFGIESINEDNLNYLDRTINKDKVKDIIDYSKKLGFNNINVDLMYGLPKEDINTLKKDLDYIFSLDIEHISTYSLIIEKHTKLDIRGDKNISEDLDYEMYKFICKEMKKRNFIHYEISNFSKSGFYSIHNTCYWLNNNYYGFGLGASSYINNKRITNTRSINKYLNKNFISEVENISKKDDIEYQIILNLRKSDGIDLEVFKNKFGVELRKLYNYDELVNNKLLVLKNNHLLILEDKWYISNEIIVKLLGSEVNG